MSINDELKNDLKPFWKKAIPWAIVFGCGYILGAITGFLVGQHVSNVLLDPYVPTYTLSAMDEKQFEDYTLTASIAADIVGCSKKTIHRWLEGGHMKARNMMVGNTLKIHTNDFYKWIKDEFDIEVER